MEAPLCVPTCDVFAVTTAESGTASDAQSLAVMDWRSPLVTSFKTLMTRRIVLEVTAGEHLRQELAAMDDLLGLGIVVELASQTRVRLPRSANSEL